MPEQTSFAVLYKKLLDSNFDPGPERAKAALNTVLRRLSLGPLPKSVESGIKAPAAPHLGSAAGTE